MTVAVADDRRVWRIPGMPHRGWECIRVVDLNPDELPSDEIDYATCEACGQHPIRFVHTIAHDEWPDELDVGRVCVEHLTGDYVNPRRREAELKRQASRRRAWLKKGWRTSARGNPWLKIGGRSITVFPSRRAPGFAYVIDGNFSRKTFPTVEAAQMASYRGYTYLNEREG